MMMLLHEKHPGPLAAQLYSKHSTCWHAILSKPSRVERALCVRQGGVGTAGGLASAALLERALAAALGDLQDCELLGDGGVDAYGVVEVGFCGARLERDGQTLYGTAQHHMVWGTECGACQGNARIWCRRRYRILLFEGSLEDSSSKRAGC